MAGATLIVRRRKIEKTKKVEKFIFLSYEANITILRGIHDLTQLGGYRKICCTDLYILICDNVLKRNHYRKGEKLEMDSGKKLPSPLPFFFPFKNYVRIFG